MTTNIQRKVTGRRGERGSTMVEALFAFILLMLIFCGFLQIFKMSAVKMLCDYSSYCAARGRAMGYRDYIVQRASRVPLMPVSGEAIEENSSSALTDSSYRDSTLGEFGSSNYDKIYNQAYFYMKYGPMIIDFAYWDEDNENNSTGTNQVVYPWRYVDVYNQRTLVNATSGFNNYPSGFEFLDPTRGRRMTLSVAEEDKLVTYDDDFTYNVNVKSSSSGDDPKVTTVTMQNYSRYIITEEYWSGE